MEKITRSYDEIYFYPSIEDLISVNSTKSYYHSTVLCADNIQIYSYKFLENALSKVSGSVISQHQYDQGSWILDLWKILDKVLISLKMSKGVF